MPQPTIREQYQALESRLLSPRAALSIRSRGRRRAEQECSIRTPFQRDRDRILHSKAFRRLKRKTQVFLSPLGDHYRTRLTHTLEVSQISRTIARALRLNEDLVEAIVLGHDLGHTPFGHAGESVLDQLLPGGFKHYRQSLRIVDVLERDGHGLNLTWEVRDGIVKHSKGMGPVFGSDSGKLPATLEGQIVRISDIIAYVNHDLDDAVRAGLVAFEDIPGACLRELGPTHSRRINTLVCDVIGSSDDQDQVLMSDEKLGYTMELREFLYRRVYSHPDHQKEFSKAKKMLHDLFEFLVQNPDRFQSVANRKNDSVQRRAADFLAGMTDTYAIELYKQLFVPQEWMSGREIAFCP